MRGAVSAAYGGHLAAAAGGGGNIGTNLAVGNVSPGAPGVPGVPTGPRAGSPDAAGVKRARADEVEVGGVKVPKIG